MIRTKTIGLKARTVSSAAIALALALFIGALLLRAQLRDAVYSSIADQTLTRATGVADLVATGDFASVLEPAGPNPGWIQVLDQQGRVVAATANTSALNKPFASTTPRPPRSRRMSGLPIDTGERVSVATVNTAHNGTTYTVIAASPLDIADASDRRIVTSLLVAFPVLLLTSTLTVWAVVRRALRPVEAIRRKVASISSSDLSRRVPEPGTRDEIDRLARTMNEMLERLQTSADRHRRFVGDASHELRSPLASLRNQLEVSTIDNPDATWAVTVNEMITDHDRLERLIRDLLLLARHDDHTPLVLEPVDLGYLVRTEMARRMSAPGIVRHVDASNALILGNPEALSRILRNLLDNAERHGVSAINVAVRSDVATNVVELVVDDDGEGVPRSERVAVFQRFRRLDDARAADAGGSGLGLAIVADLVQNHHGNVRIQDAPAGARFVVTFPAFRAEE